MYKLIRIINQNRKKILIAILAIVFGIIIIQILNQISKEENEKALENLQKQIENNKYNTSTYEPSYSIISGQEVKESVQNQAETIIDKFINSCNEGKVEIAYSLLSTNCKEELYPSLESFKKSYYERNFKTKKQYTIQSWMSGASMYKIQLYEDALATGKVQKENVIQDYYTICEENNTSKLNISEYIGKREINKATAKNGVTIIVNYKNIYKDYEIYNITIENTTENNILLNSGESTKTIYLKGDKATYTAYVHEIEKNAINLNSYNKITTEIKFNKVYSETARVSSIVFSDIILNADKYNELKNKLDYKDRVKIELDI